MGLLMKPQCERCAEALGWAAAFICSFECTFCRACADTLESVCPNCGGELVHRPKRRED